MAVPVAILVSMLIRMAKPWSSVDKKQEKPQNYYQKKFQRPERFHGKEYWK
jgi:hypothetical protein